MARIHFIGLGTMGFPMVNRLVAGGHDVWITDTNLETLKYVSKETSANIWDEFGSPAGTDVLLMMLPSSKVVELVLGSVKDASSLAASIQSPTIVLDMSSSNPSSSVHLAQMFAERGVTMVDAPVSGGPLKAGTGELSIMVGGASDDSVWHQILPILQVLGTSITRTGPAGSAHALKALNNLLSVIGIVGAVEVLMVGTKFGLDPRVMLDVINNSTGRNHATEVKIGPQVLDRAWNVGFSLDLTVKDISTALSLAEAEHVSTPVSEAVVKVATDALEYFDGEKADQSHIAQYLETLNSVSLGNNKKGTHHE